jgi:hypothetical protein
MRGWEGAGCGSASPRYNPPVGSLHMPLTDSSIARLRLRNQWITAPSRGDAVDVVRHLVAVQSQDFAGAKWALGLRLRRAAEPLIEKAFNAGRILRTHVLRPTWHFVLPQDIRWLLALTGPRVLRQSAGPYRQAGLDAATFKRAHAVLEKALRGGNHLTRDELRARLASAGIGDSHEFRILRILEHAELEGLICSGPRRGKQHTYALLDERVPGSSRFDRRDALVELARRYFLSRGPATVHDLAKWSGLTLADVRLGMEGIQPELHMRRFAEMEYWFVDAAVAPAHAPHAAHLLSVYDEYLSSYRGHTAIAPAEVSRRLRALGNALSGVIVLDGFVLGTWKRRFAKDAMNIKLDPFGRFSSAQHRLVELAAKRYAEFHGLKAVVS